MKILKEGKPFVWEKKFTCTGKGNGGHGCGAVLLVCEKDLYKTELSDMYGVYETCTTFSCPCCGVETDVKVPDSVKLLGKQPKK